MDYRYCLYNRPFSLGAQPKEGWVRCEPRPAPGEPHHDLARHGIVVYNRKLTQEEERSYELPPILSRQAISELATQVADSYTKYREGIWEQHLEGEQAWIEDAFLDKAGKLYPGLPPSLPRYFAELVFLKLFEDRVK